MRREFRRSIQIRSRDYWLKSLDNHQTNWALLDDDPAGSHCTVFFFHELSGVFDRLSFPTARLAETALRYNGFGRLLEWHDAPDGYAPPPPFFEDQHPNGPIYSSGRYWKRPLDPID